MTSASLIYELAIERFTRWADQQPDVRAAMLVGSRARTSYVADRWSDLDLIMLTSDVERHISSGAWMAAIGTPWLVYIDPATVGIGRECYALFEQNVDVNLAIFPPAYVDLIASDPDTTQIFQRGVRLLLDKDGALAAVLAAVPAPAPAQPPAPEAFARHVNEFCFNTVWTARRLGRGDLWRALNSLEAHMKCGGLLPMLAWHARATYGWQHDTWYGGRCVEQWADPQVVAALPATFARFDRADIRRALLATAALFHRLGHVVSARLEYSYPYELEQRVARWLHAQLDDPAATVAADSPAATPEA